MFCFNAERGQIHQRTIRYDSSWIMDHVMHLQGDFPRKMLMECGQKLNYLLWQIQNPGSSYIRTVTMSNISLSEEGKASIFGFCSAVMNGSDKKGFPKNFTNGHFWELYLRVVQVLMTHNFCLKGSFHCHSGQSIYLFATGRYLDWGPLVWFLNGI